MYLGNRLKDIRKDRGLSREEVCKGIISISHYSNIENGRYAPSFDTLELIASRLSIPIGYLTNLNDSNYDIEQILLVIEEMLENEEINKLNTLLHEEKVKLMYISSFKQELHFNLLMYSVLLSENKILDALSYFELKVPKIVNLEELSVHLQKKYCMLCASFYFLQGDYKGSNDYLVKASTYSNEVLETTKIKYNIALCLYKLNQIDETLMKISEVLDCYLRLQKWTNAIDCYNMLGILLTSKEKFDEAENNIKKGLELYNFVQNPNHLIFSKLCHNLAIVYLKQNKFDKALVEINKSIEIKKAEDYHELFLSYRLLLKILIEKEDLLNAIKTLEILKSLSNCQSDKAHVLYLSARINYLLGNNNEYARDITSSIQILLKEENWSQLVEITEHYSVFLEDNKKYKSAFINAKLNILSLKKSKGWNAN